MVVLKLGEPARLAAVELLRFLEILKVGVVGIDLEGVFRVDQVLPEVLKSQHYRQKLAVVYFVVPLGRAECLGHICDGLPYVVLLLEQHSSDSVGRSVGLQAERVVSIRNCQDWRSGYERAELVESILLLISPIKGCVASKGV